jgi:hypothetical protein
MDAELLRGGARVERMLDAAGHLLRILDERAGAGEPSALADNGHRRPASEVSRHWAGVNTARVSPASCHPTTIS